jgi:indole-3-glycerol phosphate synthase
LILDAITAHARKRVALAREKQPFEALREQALALEGAPPDFENALSRPGISFICEIKRASPSKGIIAEDFPYLAIAREYESAGAAALSVLTEPAYFLGNDRYLREIARTVPLPALRKDFVVDPYQIYESRVLGASAVLLICAVLDDDALASCIRHTRAAGLSALVEAHTEEEVDRALRAGAGIIGANNRDLKTFTVDLAVTRRLRSRVPKDTLFVSESGIHSEEDVKLLADAGVDGVLIGEALMRAEDKKKRLSALRGYT